MNFLTSKATCVVRIARISKLNVHHKQCYSSTNQNKNILITGSMGQLGHPLARMLRQTNGRESVVMSDIVQPNNSILSEGPYIFADILDFKKLQEIVVNYQIGSLIHFSALLSAVGENNIPLAMRVNIEGVHNILELARQYQLQVFIPSTIGAFGPDSPRNPTPDVTIQRPKTIYGVSKVHGELMGEYYSHKFGLDYRSLRFPGVISADTNPGGGTTDYAVSVFHDALHRGEHTCFLKPDTRLPMIYIDDCLRAVIEVMSTPADSLSLRTYNIAAISFTPAELFAVIKKRFPHLKVHYKPDARQLIADDWPQVFDDSNARKDWGWNHAYDIEKMCDVMFEKLQKSS